jgi:hypothetical protein
VARLTRRTVAWTVFGLGWVGLVLLPPPLAPRHPRLATLPAPPLPRAVRRVRCRTPSAKALWQARWYRTRAIQAANQARYPLLESVPPDMSRAIDTENWRRQLMASDRTGDLHRALAAGRVAVALAQTPDEEYQAREWLALIACDAGRHQEELQQARRLVQLKPRDEVSLVALRRAADCNGLGALARQAGAALNVTHPTRPAGYAAGRRGGRSRGR